MQSETASFGITAPADTRSDEECAALVQKGDHEAYATLVHRFDPKLMRYGRKFLSEKDDIEDIVQDVFVSAYQNIKGFDVSQRFSPWIYRIAHNAFVNRLRKQKRSSFPSLDFDTFLAHHVAPEPLQSEREQAEMRELVERGLSKLDPKYKEVLILYYLEEMSYKEIADILQVPTGTVGIRIKRGKEALKTAYQDIQPQHGR